MSNSTEGAKRGVYSLRWNGHLNHLGKNLSSLLNDPLCDVILATPDGCQLRAHKFLLSICSPYFKKLFEANAKEGNSNSIVILTHTSFEDLENLVFFMYNGRVNVAQKDLNRFLNTAKILQVEGLANVASKRAKTEDGENSFDSSSQAPPLPNLIDHQQTGATSFGNRRNVSSPSNSSNNSSRNNTFKRPIKKPIRFQEELDPLSLADVESSNEQWMGMPNLDNCEVNEVTNHEEQEEQMVRLDSIKQEGGGLNVSSNINLRRRSTNINYNYDEYKDEEEEEVEEVYEESEAHEVPKKIPPSRAVTGHSRNRSKALDGRKNIAGIMKGLYRVCPYCKSLIYRTNLSRHIATRHTQRLLDKGTKLFSCGICKSLYRTMLHLQQHMQKNHAQS